MVKKGDAIQGLAELHRKALEIYKNSPRELRKIQRVLCSHQRFLLFLLASKSVARPDPQEEEATQ